MKWIVLFIFLTIETQWERTYGGSEDESGFCVIETEDSCYIVTGNTYSFGNGGSDIYVIKINKDGDTIWTRCYGGSENEFSYSIKKHQSGYVIAGYKSYSGGADIYLIKIDFDGNLLWEITIGDSSYECIRDFEISQDGNFVLTGYKAIPSGDCDFYFAKIDTLGNLLWERTYGGNNDDFGYSLCRTENGYIGVGYTYSFGNGDAEIYVIRIYENGDTLWSRIFGRTGDDDMGLFISQTSDGNYVLCGSSYWTPFGYEIVYMKIDGRGELIWRQYNGSLSNDFAWCIQETFDNGYVITGNFGTLVWLLKTDSVGNALWSNMYGGSGFETGYFIKQTSDSCYIIVGKTNSYGAGANDVYVIKTKRDVKIEEGKYSEIKKLRNPVFFNILGQRIERLQSKDYPPGIYIKIGGTVKSKKIILVK